MNERRICRGGVPKDDNGGNWPLCDASVILECSSSIRTCAECSGMKDLSAQIIITWCLRFFAHICSIKYQYSVQQ